jgi:serine/threonine protein kinase
MQNKVMSRSIFIESLVGNIKDKYFFEKKLGSGGYGAVYLAKNKLTGKSYKYNNILQIGEKVAIKAM